MSMILDVENCPGGSCTALSDRRTGGNPCSGQVLRLTIGKTHPKNGNFCWEFAWQFWGICRVVS